MCACEKASRCRCYKTSFNVWLVYRLGGNRSARATNTDRFFHHYHHRYRCMCDACAYTVCEAMNEWRKGYFLKGGSCRVCERSTVVSVVWYLYGLPPSGVTVGFLLFLSVIQFHSKHSSKKCVCVHIVRRLWVSAGERVSIPESVHFFGYNFWFGLETLRRSCESCMSARVSLFFSLSMCLLQ